MKLFTITTLIVSVLLSANALANTYTSKYGDTFLGIALKHGLTQSQLQKLNPNVDIQQLKAGTKLEVGNAKPLTVVQAVPQPTTNNEQPKTIKIIRQAVPQPTTNNEQPKTIEIIRQAVPQVVLKDVDVAVIDGKTYIIKSVD